MRFKWGLLNVTWWSFVGRNQEQLDAFGAFAAEGTAQIEVITVAWLKPWLQRLPTGPTTWEWEYEAFCDLMWPEISHSQADFNEDFQERSAGHWRVADVAGLKPYHALSPKEQGPVDVIRLHTFTLSVDLGWDF